jgi:hypothetical protein
MMDLKPVAEVVAKIAPTVGAALLGPAGGIVGQVIASLFGGDINDPVALADKIKADPDAKMKLISLNYQHEESLLALANADRADARKMNVGNDWIVHFLAILYTVGFFSYVIVQEIHPTTQDKGIFHDLLNACVIILSFYFGSSFK